MRTAPATTRADRRRQTYRWLLLPRPDRWPKRRRDWLPLTLAVLLVAGLISVASWRGPWLLDRLGCRPGVLPAGDVWSAGGDCVGVSHGRYAFGLPAFGGVLDTIDRQNAAAAQNPCGTGGQVVTVGVLLTLNSPGVGGRAVHELEGIAAGQARANQPGCVYPMRLRVGQMGASEQAAAAVAERLAAAGAVAVVGMGLSDQQSATAADALASQHIPMVADLITAEGFDQNGSGDDHPGFGSCEPGADYQNGVGEGFFYRVAFRNAAQIARLHAYAVRAGRTDLDFVLTPITTNDPYTCTALPLLRDGFGGLRREVRFDPTDPTTVMQSARNICATAGHVTVFYTARARDLGRFLTTLDQQLANQQCQSTGITVLSTSDAVRLRAPELEASLERLRTDALTAPALRDRTVQLIYTPLADPDVLGGAGFAALTRAFTAAGFTAADLDDGWAINGYDALTTVATALATQLKPPITGSQVNTAINGFSTLGQAVPGAGGNITFDNHGNRNGDPVVVQLCLPGSGQPPRPSTVEVYPTAHRCP
jgi:ABC-type branched-subunit amino acid transport system substrate-binding protein